MFLFVYGLWAAYSIWADTGRPGWLNHPEVWATILVTPMGWLGGIFWLSAIPWQWELRKGRSIGLRRLAFSILFSELWVTLCTFADALLLSRLESLPLGQLVLYNLAITGGATVAAGYAIARLEEAEMDKEAAQAKARLAQQRLLQSQMHPHVLFNSLNGLAELIVKDPPAAEESVRSLSELLRRLLAAAESPLIALREERAMVEAYLALEALRLGPRMEVRWDWDASLQELEVPPLTLQPLVENAIKHGLSPVKKGGTLSIGLGRDEDGFSITVGNTVRGLRPSGAPGLGIGLKNLRERLDLAYGGKASLTLEEAGDGWTVARVRIRDFIIAG